MLRNVESMNFADIELGINQLGEKVRMLLRSCLAREQSEGALKCRLPPEMWHFY